jgi:hypothetical protein
MSKAPEKYVAIASKIEPAGIKAVLAEPKVKLIAKVNNQDNFALYFTKVAHDAMLDALMPKLESRAKADQVYSDWFNHMVTTRPNRGNTSLFDSLARQAASKAYAKLHPERCK